MDPSSLGLRLRNEALAPVCPPNIWPPSCCTDQIMDRHAPAVLPHHTLANASIVVPTRPGQAYHRVGTRDHRGFLDGED